MIQPDLLSWTPPPGHRDGRTFDAARDGKRLNAAQAAVWEILKDGNWHTPPEIAAKTGFSESGTTARIRDLRKVRFGGFSIESEYVSRGLWRYRVTG